MSGPLVLIDLSSIAYPIWHTAASDPNPNATSQQIVARVTALASGATRAAVCVDSGKSFRKDIAPTYKANRPEREAALMHQIHVAIDALRADGFPIWKADGFEADDLIASAVAKATEPVVVVSGDKDLLQLVGPTVTVKSVRDGSLIDAAAVVAKFGVRPDQMRDYLTLVGDASDNVKGAKGIGAERAKALLAKFDSIDRLYEEVAAVGAASCGLTPSVAASLQEFREHLDTTRSLITLRADAPIPFDEILAPRSERAAVPMREVEAMADETPEQDTPDEPIQTAGPTPVAALTRRVDVLAPAPTEWERQLEPRSMREAQALAENMHHSRLFLAGYGTPQAVLSTILAGRELGLQAMASLRAIHIVEGRPTLSADLIRALVIRSGLARYFRCTERTKERATFETQRGDDPPIALTYTIEEAAAAGLVKDKSGWVKSPADMLVARASAKLARLVYPDVVHGIYTPDEVQDGQSSEAVA